MSRHFSPRKHSADSLFSILLFGLYVLFLLLMLLFSANAYQKSVQESSDSRNLYTAMSYITVKIRQHDNGQDVSLCTIDDIPALCLTDLIDDRTYQTYIYLYDGELKELFTEKGSQASPEMVASIAALHSFQIEETPDGYYQFILEDAGGKKEFFVIHPGVPEN